MPTKLSTTLPEVEPLLAVRDGTHGRHSSGLVTTILYASLRGDSRRSGDGIGRDNLSPNPRGLLGVAGLVVVGRKVGKGYKGGPPMTGPGLLPARTPGATLVPAFGTGDNISTALDRSEPPVSGGMAPAGILGTPPAAMLDGKNVPPVSGGLLPTGILGTSPNGTRASPPHTSLGF